MIHVGKGPRRKNLPCSTIPSSLPVAGEDEYSSWAQRDKRWDWGLSWFREQGKSPLAPNSFDARLATDRTPNACPSVPHGNTALIKEGLGKGTLQSTTVLYCRGNSMMHSCRLAAKMTNCPCEHLQEEKTCDSSAGSLPPVFTHRLQAWRGTRAMLSRHQPCKVDLLLTVAVMSNTHGSVFSFIEIVEYLKLEGTHRIIESNSHFIPIYGSISWKFLAGFAHGTCCEPPPHFRFGAVRHSWRRLLNLRELFATQVPSQIEKFVRVLRENHHLFLGEHIYFTSHTGYCSQLKNNYLKHHLQHMLHLTDPGVLYKETIYKLPLWYIQLYDFTPKAFEHPGLSLKVKRKSP